MNIEVEEIQDREPFVKKVPRYFLLAVIVVFLYFLIFDRAYFFSGITQILGIGNKNKVVYDTFTYSFSDTVDPVFQENVKKMLEGVGFKDKKRFEYVKEGSDILITNTQKSGKNDLVLIDTYLVPVGHLYWINDSFKERDIKTVYVENIGDAKFLSSVTSYSSIVKENLVSTLEESENIPAFIPLYDLSFNYKLLYLDGRYLLDDEKEGGVRKILIARINDTDHYFILDILKKNVKNLLHDSFNQNDVAKINMTGVTAISRDLAKKIEASGDDSYPAEKIWKFLSDADLTHTSNEVSFVKGCIPGTGMRFCSAPEYLATLLKSGIDIIELTGNHNNDYGADNNYNTIQTYIKNGMDYFGGGLNDEDASKILYKEVNGTKIAFLGYNYYDTMLGTYAIASSSHAGSNSYSEEKLKEDIAEAKSNADVVIVDFQFQECYCYPDSDVIYPVCYKPLSSPDQRYTFRLAIDDGADIVVGTQAHQPQTYELYKDGIIFYGLGNLFFDQTPWIGTRQGLILTHYFINGRYVQTKITPTMYDNDMQTRLATNEEKKQLLELLKDARD